MTALWIALAFVGGAIAMFALLVVVARIIGDVFWPW